VVARIEVRVSLQGFELDVHSTFCAVMLEFKIGILALGHTCLDPFVRPQLLQLEKKRGGEVAPK